ncbi:hypothetical protein GE21DRAFT_1047 [Neurospora crassa]|uniref:Uncharacterized protein n=1 Tax=Neurospora crassa (strain ATCC 24698 / 74-OR23-1A / CBS 708.71 / DSM 1257 / FGSC 987) TaxID=367110 RepID=V5IQL2_NEUCR|nr:hypothetical protein NCU16380 [Neurospora crassa OR74A]ESA44000.1 hypothetical protein NCU16380 [Neurospora crassa OR74A]KHE83248.1 hypothetical protein GE21DRAFT_1047 [Neurospora crassa]|eukprot:XP_011393373.1 hypothetical protein NCU16380 [Neurospora crassa OR74A]
MPAGGFYLTLMRWHELTNTWQPGDFDLSLGYLGIPDVKAGCWVEALAIGSRQQAMEAAIESKLGRGWVMRNGEWSEAERCCLLTDQGPVSTSTRIHTSPSNQEQPRSPDAVDFFVCCPFVILNFQSLGTRRVAHILPSNEKVKAAQDIAAISVATVTTVFNGFQACSGDFSPCHPNMERLSAQYGIMQIYPTPQ